MRVGLLHLGQSVDFVVSITFLRSPVFAIFAMVRVFLLRGVSLHSRATDYARLQRRGHLLPYIEMEGAGLALSILHESHCDSGRLVRCAGQFGWLVPEAGAGWCDALSGWESGTLSGLSPGWLWGFGICTGPILSRSRCPAGTGAVG